MFVVVVVDEDPLLVILNAQDVAIGLLEVVPNDVVLFELSPHVDHLQLLDLDIILSVFKI